MPIDLLFKIFSTLPQHIREESHGKSSKNPDDSLRNPTPQGFSYDSTPWEIQISEE